MFLRATPRKKDGKEHRYFNIDVLDPGEINSSQELGWRRSIEVLDEGACEPLRLERLRQ